MKGPSKVYFTDLRATPRRNIFDKIDDLLEKVSLERFGKGALVAVKLHFGERGNTSYVNPLYVRRVVDNIKHAGASPFLTDTNTLYVGTRTNSVDHIRTALENGFGYIVTGAPVIIADGLRGETGVKVAIDGEHFKEVTIGREIVNADAIVVLTHFKCHELTGFGGALKNTGMGCAAREGKLAQHSNSAPMVYPSGCTGCGECAASCPADAIDIGSVASIKPSRCIGCGFCIAVCPEGTIRIQWDETTTKLQEKMVEYAKGALKGKEDKAVFMTFITHISPECDCYDHNDVPIVPDVGILVSTDPVAIDQAAADLVNGQQGFAESAMTTGHEPGGDKFRGVHPAVDWTVQLSAGQKAGIGSRSYKLEKL